MFNERNYYQIKSDHQIFDNILKEKKKVGYYKLPFNEIESLIQYAESINKKNILVVGIGGSSLGSRAIYEFIKPSRNINKNLEFLETIDPLKISSCFKRIDPENTHLIIVSKSGKTVEPISILRYIYSRVKLESSNCSVITEKGTPLMHFANENKLKFFELDSNIGGRFSVFSVVSLLPLAIVGIDVKEILKGARDVSNDFFSKGEIYSKIFSKARFLVENKARFNINVLFSYSSSLEAFNRWYVQLWAESLGKININGTRQALTPVSLIGPIDQHSFLQLIIDGVRDKTISFIKIQDFADSTLIPKDKNKSFESFNNAYLENLSFNALINHQADATIESVKAEKDIPYDVTLIPQVDEISIAKLMFSYQLLVSVIGSFLQIDTYNQPGVESGKENLITALKKI